MFFTPTHYGKKLTELNEKERELLIIDTTMTTIFRKSGDIEKIDEMILVSLTKKRIVIISEILGWKKDWNDSEIEQLFEILKDTNYCYHKFISDTKYNMNKLKNEEKLCLLN
jgi:hypothetical protein